jgi:hypothetical protein
VVKPATLLVTAGPAAAAVAAAVMWASRVTHVARLAIFLATARLAVSAAAAAVAMESHVTPVAKLATSHAIVRVAGASRYKDICWPRGHMSVLFGR